MDHAAVCLTFDDRFCHNWHAARPIFDQYGAKVTFCVHGLHQAGEDEIALLRDLQSDGHEIACHSRTHPRLQPYLDRFGFDAWLADEVAADRRDHLEAGFPGRAFASPFHHSTRQTRGGTAALFSVTRGAGPLRPNTEDIHARLYRAMPDDRAVDNLGMIDMMHPAQGGWEWLRHCLDTLAEQKGIAVFTGHDIRPERGQPGFYLARNQLSRILRAVRRRRIGFVTLSEIADLLPAGTRSLL